MIIDFDTDCNKYNGLFYSKNKFKYTNCPKCRSKGNFSVHAYYRRNVVYFANNKLIEKILIILRIRCLSCNSTHAILPYDIIPYKIFTVSFVMKLLYYIFVSLFKINDSTQNLNISHQLLYNIKNNFIQNLYNISIFCIKLSQITFKSKSQAVNWTYILLGN